MSKRYRILLCVTLAILVTSCAAPAVNQPTLPTATQFISPTATQSVPQALPEIHIARHPEPVDYSRFFPELTSIPKFNPNSDNPWQVDLRSRDLTKIDMTASLDDLMYADFDSQTQWPTSDKLPADFDWQKIMELGKDPGLGIRQLHEQGITGKGVGLAIIDQTLLVDHSEYKDRIRVYEEASDITGGWREVQMHGPAVASIATGKSIGVAPGADLYYIATGDCGGRDKHRRSGLLLPGRSDQAYCGNQQNSSRGSENQSTVHVLWLGSR